MTLVTQRDLMAYNSFSKFYYEHILADRDGISVKLPELVRHKIALINQCHL
jgi:hypothetical protein